MEKDISVIIPNYNGQDLLLANLPTVIKNCQGCEIIVVDDASTDNSIAILRKKFKKIKLVCLKTNQGFASAVNVGVIKASKSFVLLLNTDVKPKPNFLKPLLKYLDTKKYSNLFAVGLCDLSHENGKIVPKGRGGAIFRKGFVSHFALFPEAGVTFWASGGSSLFNCKMFLELNGFDKIFSPFYWEDIDLSFRAWLSGKFCLFEPFSKVDHFHEVGSIKSNKSRFFVKTVSYKNQFLFVWKNISDYFLICLHLLWLPYHFTRAIINFDLAFFAGFFWAVSQIPSLIFNYQLSTINYQLSEREVLSKFAKQ
jgi:GT2 family glycosyltransferase